VLTEHGIKIAPNSYRAHKTRPPSVRSVRDARVLAEITRIFPDPNLGRGLHGARKVTAQLARDGGVEGLPVSRRQVERLMRTAGLHGVVRGRKFRTTRPDPSGQVTRPADLVGRDFTAPAPNRLWLVDFERHEALSNRLEVRDLRRLAVAAAG